MVKLYLSYLLIIFLKLNVHAVENESSKHGFIGSRDSCFCKLHGEVDDCSCKVESLDSLNNALIYPRLKSLLSRNYFRYFKVNLKKECPFWADDSKCAIKNCAVDVCSEEQVPDGLKEWEVPKDKFIKESEEKDCSEGDLGYLNMTISEESEMAFENWTKYDDAQETFCELDDDISTDVKYVDLLLNPERYTGYKGDSPHRIWNSIYNENCFKPETASYNPHSLTDYNMEGLCLEKRAFYRLISGLHTSINLHLCHQYLYPVSTCYGKEEWVMNLEEFQRRFDPVQTNGRGPQWLKNLYFTYLVELRALAKAAPYLEEEGYFTGHEEDADVKKGVSDLLKVVKDFPEQFDESKLFKGNKHEAAALKREFRDHFRNISRIMDCVGCDKCKLWGKLQVQGMGTALKILVSGNGMGPNSKVKPGSKKKFQLRRTEIVSLFNAFGRLSKSIFAIEEFRKRLR